jgi:hypothetical protein
VCWQWQPTSSGMDLGWQSARWHQGNRHWPYFLSSSNRCWSWSNINDDPIYVGVILYIYIWIKLGKAVLLQDFTAILLWKPVGFVAFDLLTQVWCVQQSSRTLRSHFPSSGEGARMGHELHEEMHCFTKSTGFQDETLSLYVILWYGSSCTAWVGCLTRACGREHLIAWSNTSWEW